MPSSQGALPAPPPLQPLVRAAADTNANANALATLALVGGDGNAALPRTRGRKTVPQARITQRGGGGGAAFCTFGQKQPAGGMLEDVPDEDSLGTNLLGAPQAASASAQRVGAAGSVGAGSGAGRRSVFPGSVQMGGAGRPSRGAPSSGRAAASRSSRGAPSRGAPSRGAPVAARGGSRATTVR